MSAFEAGRNSEILWGDPDVYIVYGPDVEKSVIAYTSTLLDAKRIAHVLNHYDELQEALKECAKIFRHDDYEGTSMLPQIVQEAKRRVLIARTALQKARMKYEY